MLQRCFLLAVWLIFFGVSTPCFADTVVAQNQAFTGPNIYSPDVIYDAQANIDKMWYGGWQAAGQTNDNIYYRTSSGGVSWSSYTTVITPAILSQKYKSETGISTSFVHTNDPSVTKTYNNVNGTYQYTMFFDACYSPCTSGSSNSLWSMVSSDGVNWNLPSPLNVELPSGIGGPQNPTIIVDSSGPTNTFWHVYFSTSTGSTSTIYLAYVDGNRNPIGAAQAVFTSLNGFAQNPNVFLLGSTWYLTYDTSNDLNGYDIYVAKSSSNTSWTSDAPLIQNTGKFCATETSGALVLSSNTYDLYFAQIPAGSGGTCNFTQNQSIQVWRWTSP